MKGRLYKNFRWGLTGETQSMLVEDGIPVSRGAFVPVTGAEEIDLDGKFLLPALTDCHCTSSPLD